MKKNAPLPVLLGIFLYLIQFNQELLGQDSLLTHRINLAYTLVKSAPESAISIASEVHNVARKKGLPKLEADALYTKGMAYWYLGKAEFSMIAHNEALKIREEIKDSTGLGRSLNNIGLTAQHAGADSIALSFFERSFRIRKQAGEHIEMIYSATNVCDQLDRMGRTDSAMILRNKVMQWAIESNSSTALAFVTEHAGLVEEKRGNLQLAFEYFQQAYNLRKDSDHSFERTRGLLQLSRCIAVLDSNSLIIPISYASEAIETAIENGWKDLESQAHFQLSKLYDAQDDIENAYSHLVQHKSLQDIISKEESLLRTQALIAMNNDYLQREKARVDLELKKLPFLRQWLEWMVGLLIIGIILGIALYIRYERIKSQRNQLDIEKKQITETNLKLRSFSSVVSHDIKEPLRSFAYFLELMSRHGITTPGSILEAEYFEAKKRIADLSSMLEDLEIYFGLAEGVMKWRQIDLMELTKRVISDLKSKVQKNNSQINVDNLPIIETQPTLIYQILLNLTSNGLRFQKPGAEPIIDINGYTEGDYFYLTVKDNGIGIPPERINGIFKAFNRGSHHQYPGSGLGLAIVAKAVSLLEGTIEVASIPGQGSTFTVVLPVASQTKEKDLEVSNPHSIHL